MLNSNNPSYLSMDEIHRAGKNLRIVKYSGSLSKYLVGSPIFIMELAGGFQRTDNSPRFNNNICYP